MRTFRVVAVLLLACAASAQQTHPTKPAENAVPNASELKSGGERIRAHVKFLSSDLLEGRGTGQRGGDIAAEYLASQFELLGLKPAGDQGYMQRVPMVGITTMDATGVSIQTKTGSMRLRNGDDIVAMDETQNPAGDVTAPLIFVGYGISAPEFKWDDYKGVDAKGKVLLMFVNEPPSEDASFFKGKALTYYGRWTYKFEEAARRGAAGVILIHKSEMASYGWNVVRNSWGGERSYLRDDSKPKLKLAGWIQLELARQLLGSAGLDLESALKQAARSDFRPVELGATVNAHIASRIRPFESSNVLAMLPGSNANLKEQAVVYSAHYDHLGIHPGQTGDNIYNGAIDNASGCGVLLEIARTFAMAAQKPQRSILFAAVTGEEQGLLGSAYLAAHSPVSPKNIMLGLNFDSFAPYGLPAQVSVSGAERTTFYDAVEQVARTMNLEIRPDSNPAAGGYYRSDHFSFARLGVPAFSVGAGGKFRDEQAASAIRARDKARGETYHQPTDEYQVYWDFSGLAYMARFGVTLGAHAANQQDSIGWQKGDEFEAARLASE